MKNVRKTTVKRRGNESSKSEISSVEISKAGFNQLD